MNTEYMNSLPVGGFNYDNCIRNNALVETAMSGGKLTHMKTGTTICGMIFKVSLFPKVINLLYRMESFSLPIPEPPEEPLSETKIAKRFIISLQIFTVRELEPPPIATTLPK